MRAGAAHRSLTCWMGGWWPLEAEEGWLDVGALIRFGIGVLAWLGVLLVVWCGWFVLTISGTMGMPTAPVVVN